MQKPLVASIWQMLMQGVEIVVMDSSARKPQRNTNHDTRGVMASVASARQIYGIIIQQIRQKMGQFLVLDANPAGIVYSNTDPQRRMQGRFDREVFRRTRLVWTLHDCGHTFFLDPRQNVILNGAA